MDTNRFRQLWDQIAASRTRLTLVVSVLAVGLLLWGRLILLERVPRIATADPDAAATAPADPPAGEKDSPALSDTPHGPADEVRYPADRYNRTEDQDSPSMNVQNPGREADNNQGRRD